MEEEKPTLEPEDESSVPSASDTGPAPAEAPRPAPEIATLKAALEEKGNELKAAQDKLLRVYADLENFKKRTARDQFEQLRFANEKLLKELLPVLDNLERALIHIQAAPEMARWTDGVELTCRQCLEVLKKFGVTPITSVGEPFDPNRHQAVTYIDTRDYEENHVAEELQKGYFYHERVLRPSMVAVARRSSPSSAAGEAEKPDQEESSE